MGCVGWDQKVYLFLIFLFSIQVNKKKDVQISRKCIEIRDWPAGNIFFNMIQKAHKHKMPYFVMHGEQPLLLGSLQLPLLSLKAKFP